MEGIRDLKNAIDQAREEAKIEGLTAGLREGKTEGWIVSRLEVAKMLKTNEIYRYHQQEHRNCRGRYP